MYLQLLRWTLTVENYIFSNGILKSSKIHSKKNSIVPIVGTKKGESVRGLIVKKIMKERGVNLGQASKIVKEEKLY